MTAAPALPAGAATDGVSVTEACASDGSAAFSDARSGTGVPKDAETPVVHMGRCPAAIAPRGPPARSLLSRSTETLSPSAWLDLAETINVARGLSAPAPPHNLTGWRKWLFQTHYPYADDVLAAIGAGGCSVDTDPQAHDSTRRTTRRCTRSCQRSWQRSRRK